MSAPVGPPVLSAAVAPAPVPSSALEPPRLHFPDEPIGWKDEWRTAVLDGQDLLDVVVRPGGIADWLWARWSALSAHGIDAAAFRSVVADYRRELWFWLLGERLWEQCCAGLIGRFARRLHEPV